MVNRSSCGRTTTSAEGCDREETRASHSVGGSGCDRVMGGVPAVDVVAELTVKDSCADLEESRAPAGVQGICCFLTIRFAMT